jgi:hypothetical protein
MTGTGAPQLAAAGVHVSCMHAVHASCVPSPQQVVCWYAARLVCWYAGMLICWYAGMPAVQVHAYLEGAFGKEQFESMSAALCTPPTVTCLRVNTLRASTEVRRRQAATKRMQAGRPPACVCVHTSSAECVSLAGSSAVEHIHSA